jgi:hypothetical protein
MGSGTLQKQENRIPEDGRGAPQEREYGVPKATVRNVVKREDGGQGSVDPQIQKGKKATREAFQTRSLSLSIDAEKCFLKTWISKI